MVHIPEKARQYYLPKRENINDLTLRTFDVPKPATNEVLVKIHAVALNYRDILVATDRYRDYGPVADNLVPCSDCAGEVVAVGQGVSKWAVGDRVTASFLLDYVGGGPRMEYIFSVLGGSVDGVLTEYRLFPAHSLTKIPDSLTYEEASTLPCAAVTAWNALQGPVPVKAGDNVLVLGTGGVSIFVLQFAAASGATVIATSSSDEKLAKAKELGAKYLINYKQTPDWDQEVFKLTKGEGARHVVDVGGASTISQSIGSLGLSGWVHLVGHITGNEHEPLLGKLTSRNGNMRTIKVGSLAMLEDLIRALDANGIKPVIDSVFSFDQAVDALKHLESQKHVGKVVIRVASN